MKKSLYDGTITLNNTVINCSVLDDGTHTRVLSQSEITKALGRAIGGSKRGEAKLPRWISAQNINRYISEALAKAILHPIKYITKGGNAALGIEAKYLPEICNVWLNAKDDGVLTEHQLETAKNAEVLIRALAHVGIIALVDEATGFQDFRDKDTLQSFLDEFLLKERAKWVRRFPDEFFQLLFKMKGWTFNYASTKKPQFVGRYINDLVYDRLAPFVHEELKKKNPVINKETGYRKGKHHSWLTEDIGVPKLQEHLFALITLAKASGTNWNTFYRMVQRSLPKYGDNLQIDFPEN
jgi:hypothetical protein